MTLHFSKVLSWVGHEKILEFSRHSQHTLLICLIDSGILRICTCMESSKIGPNEYLRVLYIFSCSSSKLVNVIIKTFLILFPVRLFLQYYYY